MSGNSKDIYSSFQPIYKFFYIIGIIGFTFDSKRRTYVVTTKREIIVLFVSTSLISIQFLMVLHCHITIDSTSSLRILLNIDSFLMFTIVLIYFIWCKHRMVKLFEKIDTFDKGIYFQYYGSTKFTRYFIMNWIHLLLYITIDIVVAVCVGQPVDNLCLGSYYNSTFCNLLVRLTFVFFINEMLIRFKFLKDKATKKKITLSKQHLIELGDICRLVNALYSLPLGRNFVRLFTFLTMNLVYFFLEPSFVNGDNTFNNVINALRWILAFLEMVFIVHPVEYLYTEIRTTTKKLEENITEDCFKGNELFNLQLYSNNIKFIVFGVFPVDYTLVYTMISGTVTYLIYLVQFRAMEK